MTGQPDLETRWRGVLDGITIAARQAGRNGEDVRLVAVSKFHPASVVAKLARLGQRDFGENYIQEARAKQAELAGLVLSDNVSTLPPGVSGAPAGGIRWHAIGPIQTNKAKEAAGHFLLIHTLASFKLAEALARRLEDVSGGDGMDPESCPSCRVQDTLIQVNIGEEVQKAGVSPVDLPALGEALLTVRGVRVLGLMCLPPRCGEGELARPYFSRLRELRDDLERRLGIPLPHLSMGMSGDYRQAVAEGATLVRVGTEIFGPRPAQSGFNPKDL